MNRAQKRHEKKLARKAAKKGQSTKAINRTSQQKLLTIDQQTLTIEQALKLARQHHNSGQLPQAESIYQEVLRTDPDQPVALHLLGVIAHQVGKNDIAVDLIMKALAIDPGNADAHNNLGIVFRKLGKLDEAVASYQKALTINPDYADAHNNLGNAFKELERFDEAEASYHKVIAINPGYAQAHNNLGAALQEQGKLDEAIASFQEAIANNPQYTDAHYNLGAMLQDMGRLDDALASYHKVIAIDPDYAQAHNNLGVALQDQGKLDEALVSYDTALTIKPDYADTRYNKGITLLLAGRLKEGWDDYAWRWRTNLGLTRMDVPAPVWAGENVAGKTVLIYAEQGSGDIIQFSRYIPLVAARGARVIIAVPKSLQRVLGDLEGVDAFVDGVAEVGHIDFHTGILDLPGIFQTSLENIPINAPPLQPDDALKDEWAARLAPYDGFRVGLVWAGDPKHVNDHNRSMDPSYMKPLTAIEGVSAFSFQIGRNAEAEATFGDRVTDLAPHLTNFSETAAAMANLDLVISVDTAPVHLAGALGCPVWTLLPYAPDWRWMLNRDDSPWYPTMRLFRQETPRDWEVVIKEVEEMLKGLLA